MLLNMVDGSGFDAERQMPWTPDRVHFRLWVEGHIAVVVELGAVQWLDAPACSAS